MNLLIACERTCSPDTQSQHGPWSRVWRVNDVGVLDGKVAIVTGTSRGVGAGIAAELLRAGATVIGCSRGELDGPPGRGQAGRWRAHGRPQWSATRATTRPSTPWWPGSRGVTGGSTSWSTTQAARFRRPPPRRSPNSSQQIQGAPRADDDFERTALFHSFAIQMNLISPLWFAIRVYRQMRTQDGLGSIINISSGAGHPAARPRWSPTVPRRPGSTTSPGPWPRSGGPRPGELPGPRSDDDRQLPVVRAARRRSDGRRLLRASSAGPRGEPAEVGRACVFLSAGASTTSTAPPSRSTAACCPASSTTPA